MAGEWSEQPLGGLVQNFDARRVPLSSREREKRRGSFPYYGATGIMDYVDDFLFEGLHLLVAEDGSVERPDGKPFLQLVDGRFWVNNHAHVLRGATDEDTKYLFYALSTVAIRPYVSGSVQAKLSQANLNKIPIPYPEREADRRAIAHILGTLDDKIELNRRMGETLEAMARALFKSWFVDFDPVRAKSEGRDPSLPQPLADLFPARLVDSELGEIPEGWEVGSFGNLISQRSERVGGRDVVVLSAVASGKLVKSDDHFTKRVYSKETDKYLLVERWDFAYNPSRINIGSIGMLEEDIVGGVSPVYVVARPLFAYRWFLEFSIRREHTKAWIRTLASGSVRQSLSYADFASIPCVIPPERVVQEFNRKWADWREGIQSREGESRTLAALRDALLPKLISGELRVKDAEKFIGRAV